MDISPNFCGLSHHLSQVLNALDLNHLEPEWTLKENKGKVLLNIVWTRRPFKFPARDENKGPTVPVHGPTEYGHGSEEIKPSTSQAVPVNRGTKTDSVKTRKKKSPSTLRRDRERQRKWRESKQQTIVPPCRLVLTCHAEKQIATNEPNITKLLNHDNSRVKSPTINENLEYLAYLEGEIERDGQEMTTTTGEIPRSETTVTTQDQCLQAEQAGKDSDQDSEFDQNFEEMYRLIEKEAEEEYNDTELINRCFNLNCLKPETSVPGGLKRCTGCKIAVYCCRDCQANHWGIHRSACGKNL